MSDKKPPLAPVVLPRETSSIARPDTLRPFDAVSLPTPSASASKSTLGGVVSTRLGAMRERNTTVILAEVEKQSASIRTITTNLTEAYKTRVETAVFVEQKMVEFLEANRKVTALSNQMRIDQILLPDQLELQRKQLQPLIIDSDAEIDAAIVRRGFVSDAETHRHHLQRALDRRRAERLNEREEEDHQLYLADSAAKRRGLAPEPPALGAGTAAGDIQEAANVAEDVADGHVPDDAAHPYHGFAALAFLGCVRRGMSHDDAFQDVARKVLDRMQRHPLAERDARVYHQRYREAAEQHNIEVTQAKRDAAKARRNDLRVSEARLQQEAVLGKAAMERDAAAARERTARIFMNDDGYSAEDDSDVH